MQFCLSLVVRSGMQQLSTLLKNGFNFNRLKIRHLNYLGYKSVNLSYNNEGLLKSAQLGMNILIFLFY